MDITNLSKDRKNRRKSSIDLSTMVYGKVPPQAKDLEEAVLGAILLESWAFDEVAQILKPECFYVDAHKRIFQSISSLVQKSQPIDTLTVIEELRRTEELDMIGGPYYVTKLTNAVVSAAHVAAHSKIVFQKFVQREVIRVSGQLISDAYEDSTDCFDLLDSAEAEIFAISNNIHSSGHHPIDKLLVAAYKDMEDKRNSDDELSGVTSGFVSIDKVTHGWRSPDLIILAARPSVGKTALALNLARNASMDPKKPTPTAYFSLEMSARQLINRAISSESGIPLEKIMKGRLEDGDMETVYKEGIKKLSNAPLYIDDTPSLNIFELRAKCRRLKNSKNIGLIIVDYLQLMTGTGATKHSNREQVISDISRGLKGLAKELDVPIIALSQLSRETEKRKDPRPILADLRESGAIEQDADTVVFIYRPEYYNVHHSETGESNVGETILRFAKHRNGTLETIKLRACLWIQKFEEYSEPPKSPIYKGTGLDFKRMAANDTAKSVASQFNINPDEDDPF